MAYYEAPELFLDKVIALVATVAVPVSVERKN